MNLDVGRMDTIAKMTEQCGPKVHAGVSEWKGEGIVPIRKACEAIRTIAECFTLDFLELWRPEADQVRLSVGFEVLESSRIPVRDQDPY